MSDILERLREAARGGDVFVSPGQAADEIERLQARIAELEGVLDQLLDDMSDGLCVCEEAKEQARAALAGEKS